MDTKEKETELVQLVRQLRDYVILDRKDYEKLVQNSSPEKFNESALEARDGQKVIIENSRGLRLGFFIELAEYFIFFIFKLLCVHKDEKQNFLYMYRNEKQ